MAVDRFRRLLQKRGLVFSRGPLNIFYFSAYPEICGGPHRVIQIRRIEFHYCFMDTLLGYISSGNCLSKLVWVFLLFFDFVEPVIDYAARDCGVSFGKKLKVYHSLRRFRLWLFWTASCGFHKNWFYLVDNFCTRFLEKEAGRLIDVVSVSHCQFKRLILWEFLRWILLGNYLWICSRMLGSLIRWFSDHLPQPFILYFSLLHILLSSQHCF